MAILKEKIRLTLFREHRLFCLRVPKEKKDLLASFPRWSIVLRRRENGDYLELKVMANPRFMVNFLPYLSKGEENW
ncbi:MAG: hypothetical protein FJY81_00170 [Candidatus Aminicenantes bacterium]|nr:hypothetical protein [Candidatus Aminicenantes bacterium]